MTDIDLSAFEREQPEDPDLDEQTAEAAPVDEDTFDPDAATGSRPTLTSR